MRQVIQTVLFWITLVLISGWVLRRFYFSNDAKFVKHLRLTAFIINLIVIFLFFFDWVPPQQKGLYTGWGLILMGNFSLALLFLLLFISGLLFITGRTKLIKIGAALEIISTIFLFKIMTDLIPGAAPILLQTSAPIFVAFLLLINSVVVLLLWHQLQKQNFKLCQK